MEKIVLEWKSGMEFDTLLQGHKIVVDGPEIYGGVHAGPSPKPLILVSLAGCTGMDVASLAQKMRVELDEFTVAVSANVSEEIPVVYTSIHLEYHFTGTDVPVTKALRMVELSLEKYCGVAAMLRKAALLTRDVYVNGRIVG